MILLLNTSTPVCEIDLVRADEVAELKWQADRQLAKGLLAFIHDQLTGRGLEWKDITGIGVYEGPGSFTGLRIGLTVMNTLADSLEIPIVGTHGDDWKTNAKTRLESGENDRIVLPHYGSEANITTPRK